jgi:hypothetical protein
MLQETMTKQTHQAFKTLRAAIENCPDEVWKAGEGSYLVVARLAFSDAADLWDQARTLTYLDEMLAKTLAFVENPTGLLSEDVAPQWFVSRLDHLCYALRHLAQHTGEINVLLRQADARVGKW